MGKKIPVVSYLCGALTRKKNPTDNNPKKEDSDYSTKSPPSHGGESSPEQPTTTSVPPFTDQEETLQNQPLPPPPGRIQPQHLRTSSYHHQHSRSNSAVSRLTSSLSLRVLPFSSDGGGEKNKKKLKHEDSIWKKTIILGEKCKVPDEDDEDTILYDEKGNRISTYHQKNTTFSRQNSGIDDELNAIDVIKHLREAKKDILSGEAKYVQNSFNFVEDRVSSCDEELLKEPHENLGFFENTRKLNEKVERSLQYHYVHLQNVPSLLKKSRQDWTLLVKKFRNHT